MADKKIIVFACGAGINTSTIAMELIGAELKNRGFTNVELVRINMADIERWLDRLSVLVEMTRSPRPYGVPTVKGFPFLTGDKEGQKQVIEQIVNYIS